MSPEDKAEILDALASVSIAFDRIDARLDGIETSLGRVNDGLDRIDAAVSGILFALTSIGTKLDAIEAALDRPPASGMRAIITGTLPGTN